MQTAEDHWAKAISAGACTKLLIAVDSTALVLLMPAKVRKENLRMKFHARIIVRRESAVKESGLISCGAKYSTSTLIKQQ